MRRRLTGGRGRLESLATRAAPPRLPGRSTITSPDLTPQEYELYLKDLAERLRDFLERSEGRPDRLKQDAEDLLGLADAHPDVFARHSDVEGLVAEMLARVEQTKFRSAGTASREAPGCMFGWLLGRRK